MKSMIKANELQVGNLILLGGKHIVKIARIDSEQNTITTENTYNRTVGGMTGDNIYLPSGFATAIPLTPEWLERCGLFENGSSYEGDLRFKGCGHLTIEVIENGGLGYFAPFNKTIEIKHVHQLQNLYFALTGEELNVKL